MKRNLLIIFLSSFFLFSCSEEKNKELAIEINSEDSLLEIPNITIDKSELYYNNKKSIWTLNEKLYSGYAVVYYRDSILKEKIGIFEGKKQNETIHWFPDGHYKYLANYHKGKLHGEKKAWSTDSTHVLISHLNYHSGKAHGQQKKWYATGEIFKILNLNMGREEGMQKAYRRNGVLFANYEARDGRIFGIKKAELCYGIEDGEIQN